MTSPARPMAARAPQPVKLVAKDKVELSATYFPPKEMDAKNTAVLLVHDAGSDSSSVKALAEAWNKRGTAVLSLDLRGHGASKAERVDWDAASEKEREVLWAMAKRDLEAAEEYLRDRREVHSSRIVVAGRGAGRWRSLRIRRPGIAGVASWIAVDDEKTWGIDLQKGLADLVGTPTLILCSRRPARRAAPGEAAHEANDGYDTWSPGSCARSARPARRPPPRHQLTRGKVEGEDCRRPRGPSRFTASPLRSALGDAVWAHGLLPRALRAGIAATSRPPPDLGLLLADRPSRRPPCSRAACCSVRTSRRAVSSSERGSVRAAGCLKRQLLPQAGRDEPPHRRAWGPASPPREIWRRSSRPG